MPPHETQIVINEIFERFGTRTVLPARWDIGRERYPLEPARPEVLEVIVKAFEHIEPLVGQSTGSASPQNIPSTYPSELRIYTLKGLAGSPGGGYDNDVVQLTIPGSIDLHAIAPLDIHGTNCSGTVEDEIAHAAMHEVFHRFTVLKPEMYEDYVQRFWRQNKDGTWSIKDRQNLTGYRGEPNPWEAYADILADVSIPIQDTIDQRLTEGPYGSGCLSDSSRVFLYSRTDLRQWVERSPAKGIFKRLPQLAIPLSMRN